MTGNHLDEAYAELGELCGPLFESMGLKQPSREEFDKLMGPLLQQEKGDAPHGDMTPDAPAVTDAQLSSAASFDDDADFVIDRGLAGNAAFTSELQAELRRRLERKKAQAGAPKS